MKEFLSVGYVQLVYNGVSSSAELLKVIQTDEYRGKSKQKIYYTTSNVFCFERDQIRLYPWKGMSEDPVILASLFEGETVIIDRLASKHSVYSYQTAVRFVPFCPSSFMDANGSPVFYGKLEQVKGVVV